MEKVPSLRWQMWALCFTTINAMRSTPAVGQLFSVLQVAVPIVLIFVFGAAGSILFGGELIDKTLLGLIIVTSEISSS